MRRSAAIALMVMGCTADDGPMRMPPGDELPPDVWEPMPGASVASASLAAEGDDVWWAVAKREPVIGSAYSNWLLATEATGAPLVAPTEITPDNPSGYHPDVVVTPGAIVTKVEGVNLLMRRYSHTGAPLGAAFPVTIAAPYQNTNTMALTPTPAGGVQLVTSLQSDTVEVAIVDIDASGAVGATHTAGTPDTTEPGGSTAWTVAAAARPDGSTLLAWDRGYNACISSREPTTLTTVFDGASAGAVQPVHDPSSGEAHPTIAATGDAAFVAWISDQGITSRIELARYPDLTTVLAQIDSADDGYFVDMKVVLSGADRGAIVYRQNPGALAAGEEDSGIYVVSFEDRAGVIVVGTPHRLPIVETDKSPWLAGLVSIGSDRYVVGWIEAGSYATDDESHLYAAQLDLAGEAMRPAPPAPLDVTVQPRPRRVRCP